jgi:hypothetical protein
MKKDQTPNDPYPAIVDSYKAATAGIRKKKHLDKSAREIAFDMLVVLERLEADLNKYLDKDMEAAALRARRNSKILTYLGKEFRIQSTKK